MSATLLPPYAGHNDQLHPGLLQPEAHHGSGVAWPAIFAGAFASVSVTLILVTLGSGFGLAAASPWSGQGASATTLTAVGAIWLVVLYWFASSIGGYITGRLRTKWTSLHTHEVFFRDTANGFITWAVATVFGAAVAATIAASAVNGAAGMASGLASSAVSAAAGGAASDHGAYVLDGLFRGDHATATDPDVKTQSGRILLNAASTGVMPDGDKAYLSQAITARTGIGPADASKRIDTVMADMAAAKIKAKDAVDVARKAASTVSIFTGLAMLIGAFVACVAAAIGGQQRDEY